MIPYAFHPDAEVELDHAARYYESRSAGLGTGLAQEVERTIALIREFPESGRSAGSNRRRIRVARFPYTIVYRADPDRIVILAVAHQRRRPGYWRARR